MNLLSMKPGNNLVDEMLVKAKSFTDLNKDEFRLKRLQFDKPT